MNGKIIKGIAGFYYVHVPTKGVYECKARGIFRNENIKPLIGDNVSIEILENEDKKGNIQKISSRENELVRPLVANIGQVIIVFAANNPKPNFNLLDRFLIMTERKGIKAIVCFNKIEIATEDEVKNIEEIYIKAGYSVYLTSAENYTGINDLTECLYDTTTVFAGPSGVGKSSILNLIQSEVELETGELSKKIKRGKHTTRHAELICFHKNSYVVDTPGFSSLNIDEIDKDELKDYFIEFSRYKHQCKFNTCRHLSEPNCGVKEAIKNNEISESRYNSYRILYEELNDIRRW